MPPNVTQKKVSPRYQKHGDHSSTGSGLLSDVQFCKTQGQFAWRRGVLDSVGTGLIFFLVVAVFSDLV